MYRFGSQSRSGAAGIGGGSEGCVYIELTTQRSELGPGPGGLQHPRRAQALHPTRPALRHVKMLSSLVSEDGNRVLVPGLLRRRARPAERRRGGDVPERRREH